MRAKVKALWEKTKLPLLIILLCLGTWGWTTFAFLFPPMQREANQVWQWYQNRQLNKDIKTDADSVEEVRKETEAESGATSEGRDAVNTTSLPPSGVEKIIRNVAKKEKFEDADLLVRIAKAESGLDPMAKNPLSSATGIYQILDMHKLSKAERCNPEIATRWAINKIRNGGISAWNSSRKKWEI